jgi:L-histidine Nalpha-methyltransferase
MESQILLSEIAADTLKGLSSAPKFLLSKYFYDDAGSAIFQDIMKMPEYYLTDCEFEIFSTHKENITKAFTKGQQAFELVELGSGDGLKTKVLLQHLSGKKIDFQYVPVDISEKANNELAESLNSELPGLQIKPRTGDYFVQLKKLNGYAGKQKVILFLGSNIGNFSDRDLGKFLYQLSEFSCRGDKVLIGFDLKKSPGIIINAYSDPHGHTRRFNLNLLKRLNRELNADFNPDFFEHYSEYNPETGEVKSFLVSKIEQKVTMDALNETFHFEKWEPVFMELSRKFDLATIERLAVNHGFRVENHFTDSRGYFVDSLWEKI